MNNNLSSEIILMHPNESLNDALTGQEKRRNLLNEIDDINLHV